MNLSVIWRLQDLMTPAINRVNKVARSTQHAVERANVAMSRGFKISGQSVDGLRDKIAKLRQYRDGLIIGVDTREIRRANSELGMLERHLDKVELRNNRARQGGGFLSGFRGLKGLAAGYGVYAAIGAGQDALTKGMEMGANEAMFKSFVGNADKAQRIIDQLKNFSNNHPIYDNSTLLSGATAISDAMGSDRVMAITNMVAKLAKGNTFNYEGIITRLQQIKSTGYLQGDELNELMNRGVHGLQEEIAKFKGISIERFNKLKTAQKISYKDVEDALMRMTSAGGKYDKNLEDIEASAWGKWARIKKIVENKAIEIGLSTGNALTGAMDWVTKFMNRAEPINNALGRLRRSFKPLFNGIYRIAVAFGLITEKGDSVGTTIGVITSIVDKLTWLMNVAGNAVNFVGKSFQDYPWLKYAVGFLVIGNMIKSATIATSLLTIGTRIWALAAAPFNFVINGFRGIAAAAQLLWANPVGIVALGVIALGAAIYFAWQKSETFRRVTIQTWEALKYLWNGAVDLLMTAWNRISPVFSWIGEKWRQIMTLIKVYSILALAWVEEKFGWLIDGIVWAFDQVKPFVSDFWEWFNDKAFKAVRVTRAIATLGLSEIGIILSKKFKIGYDKGAAVANRSEDIRRMNDALNQGRKGALGQLLDKTLLGLGIPEVKIPGLSGGGGTGAGSSAGVTDTVTGSVTKQVTINLNSPVATLNNYFSSDDSGLGKKVSDMILIELNKILIQGDRLALE